MALRSAPRDGAGVPTSLAAHEPPPTPYGIVLGVVIFTAVAQATNLVVNAQLLRSGFQLPFTLLWYTGCTKSALAIPKIIDLCRGQRGQASTAGRSLLDEFISVRGQTAGGGGEAANIDGADVVDESPKGTLAAELVCLLILFVLYVAANASALVAVSTLSAGVFSAIFSTAPAFVCLFSRLLLRRPFAAVEAAAIVLSVTGMLCVAQPWKATSVDGGAILAAVLSPIAAAAYTVYFSSKFTNIGWKEVGFILGKLAVIIFVVGGVFLIILVAAGVEPPVWEHNFSVTQKVLIAACAVTGWMFNGGINYAVTITYPLFVSVGGVTSTLLVVLATGVLDNSWPVAVQWIGMCLIGLGSVMLASMDLLNRKRNGWRRASDVGDDDIVQ